MLTQHPSESLLVLKTCKICFRTGANQSWFHLYELVQPPALNSEGPGVADDGSAANSSATAAASREDALSSVAVALEQFMQTATLGEYTARLRLLASFRRHARVQVDFPGRTSRDVMHRLRLLVGFCLQANAQKGSGSGQLWQNTVRILVESLTQQQHGRQARWCSCAGECYVCART